MTTSLETKWVDFTKVESIGNDFVLLTESALDQEYFSQFAIQACERRFAVGSDGLLVVGGQGPDIWMRMFNPDGTEDFCGNGLRCAAHFAHQVGLVGTEFSILHLGRKVQCTIDEQGNVNTTLGLASFKPIDVPHSLDYELFDSKLMVDGVSMDVSSLTTGSTHLVVHVNKRPTDHMFDRISPQLENHPLFPERTSVIYTWESGPRELSIRIWERGVGETKGCGSGSSAAAVAWMRLTGKTGQVAIKNPGGTVTLQAEGWDQPLTLTGTAEIAYSGVFPFRLDLS